MDIIFALGGLVALLTALLPRLIHRLPVSLPLVFLGLGLLVYLLPLGLPVPDPVGARSVVEHTTELIVIVSLMGAGLALNRPFGARSWSSTWRMLGLVMPLTVAGVAAAAVVVLDWPPTAALVLAAALAPTDPVLASDVRVGEPTDSERDEDEVRFTLTSEAGLNDGFAFPIVYAAVAFAAAGGLAGAPGWLGEWVTVDLLYRSVVGIAAGLLVGALLGRLFFRAGWRTLRLAEQREGFVAVAATFLAYGGTELVGGYGFVAVFVTACRIRAVERSHGYHGILHGFIEQVERLLTSWLLLLLGGYVASGGLAELSWRGAAVGLLLLVVIRPLAGWLGQLGGRPGRAERRLIAIFGIRGVGSLYYLAFALGVGDFGVPARELWAVVAFTVLASVVLHGFAVTPLMSRVDRRRRLRAWRRRPDPGDDDIAAERP